MSSLSNHANCDCNNVYHLLVLFAIMSIPSLTSSSLSTSRCHWQVSVIVTRIKRVHNTNKILVSIASCREAGRPAGRHNSLLCDAIRWDYFIRFIANFFYFYFNFSNIIFSIYGRIFILIYLYWRCVKRIYHRSRPNKHGARIML